MFGFNRKSGEKVMTPTSQSPGDGSIDRLEEGVMCSSGNPWFVGSNPVEVDGFFQDVKILSISPPGGTFSGGPDFEIPGLLRTPSLKK